MLPMFQQSDEIKTDSFINQSTSSLLSTLSKASGWLNPYRISANRARQVLISSFTLLAASSAQASRVCFESQGDHGNTLSIK